MSPAAPRSTNRSCAATMRSSPAFRNRSTCWSRRCARSALTSTCTTPSNSAAATAACPRRPNKRITEDRRRRKDETSDGADLIGRPSSVVRHPATPNGENNEPRDYESFQPAGAGSGLRPDPDFDRQPGEDSVLVVRRDQKAGDHQLPHLQAGARPLVL